jgi:hypothetical protein
MIIPCLELRDEVSEHVLRNFDNMSWKPARDVTPLYKSMGTDTVAQYHIKLPMDGFIARLARLPRKEREKVRYSIADILVEKERSCGTG